MLQCQCRICLNTAKITEKQQASCGIITEMTSDPRFSNSESFKYKTSITGNTFNISVGEDDYD